jgi:acyl-CoA synthetase (AMP-forming)/AMP-acid ligase II
MRLHDFFDYHVREHPDSQFAVMGDRTFTYNEASTQVNRLANAFTSAEIKKGDRVAFLSKNSIEYAFMFYAGARSGVVPVPLNYRLAPHEWSFIINDSQAKMVLASPEYLEAVDGVRPELETVSHYVSVGATDSPGWTDFHAWVGAQPDSAPSEYIEASDDIIQMYTSGTTGLPKGVVLTHNSLTANVAQCIPEITMPPGHRMLVVAPLYHIAASFTSFIGVRQGGCLIIHEYFNPVEVVRTMDEDKINWTILVPAIVQACLVAVPDVAQREYADLEIMAYGGSPIAEETLAKGLEVFK